MGGRGSNSATAGAIGSGGSAVFKNEGSIELENVRHRSSGYKWRNTILEAKDIGDGGISLEYATPKNYSNPNGNTTEAVYSISHGVWNGQVGSPHSDSIGIDWDKVSYVTGQTFDVKDYIKDKGMRWDRDNKRWSRA